MKSRRNLSRTNEIEILIDTSFLLPTLGIETEKEVLEAVRYFKRIKVFYLEISLIEAMWSIIKRIPFEKMEVVNDGILAIQETYNLVSPPANAYGTAWKIYKKAHKDFIDNLLYTTSRELGIRFLTIDKIFVDNLMKNRYATDNIIDPKVLLEILEN